MVPTAAKNQNERSSHPGLVPLIAQEIAHIKQVSMQQVLQITREATKKMYGIWQGGVEELDLIGEKDDNAGGELKMSIVALGFGIWFSLFFFFFFALNLYTLNEREQCKEKSIFHQVFIFIFIFAINELLTNKRICGTRLEWREQWWLGNYCCSKRSEGCDKKSFLKLEETNKQRKEKWKGGEESFHQT